MSESESVLLAKGLIGAGALALLIVLADVVLSLLRELMKERMR